MEEYHEYPVKEYPVKEHPIKNSCCCDTHNRPDIRAGRRGFCGYYMKSAQNALKTSDLNVALEKKKITFLLL